jgi:DNA-binding NarL/FixJ family response regulator
VKKITILMAEDHAVVRQGLCALLKAECDIEVIATASNGREAVRMARTLRPDVILMDIAMPILNGFQATRQILKANPAAKILILSAHRDKEYVEFMAASGAVGFMEKRKAYKALAKAIRGAAKGDLFFNAAVAKRIARNRKARTRLRQRATKRELR